MSFLWSKLSKIITLSLKLFVLSSLFASVSVAQSRRPAGVGQRAVVIDERLAALRDEPSLSARLIQRMSRGRMVSVIGTRRSAEGLSFYRVAVTRRTRGWLQADSIVLPSRAGDDERLVRLIRGSEDFDRVVRARIFLDLFPRSPLQPAVLLLYGEAAESAAQRLSREAARRLEEREMTAGGAPLFSYFMNYNGLDRYNRQGISFVFDRLSKQFRYEGWAWREVVRRYPRSPEAIEARKRLDSLSAMKPR